jgi:hypothetical protein
MRTIIAGSRDLNDRKALMLAISRCGWKITEVVCGGAKGMDALGKEWAESQDIPVVVFAADWDKHGKRAGPLRNCKMAGYADALICVRYDQGSPGSAHMVKTARACGLRVHDTVIKREVF